jgi:tetratricopeptide (TPR) repeat protein
MEYLMTSLALPSWILAGAAGFALLVVGAAPSVAVGPEPAPAPPKRCAQHKQGSDAWKRCMSRTNKNLKDDAEIYAAGYWLAMSGEHTRALDVLRMAGNAADPRVQTMIGFSLRQMGRVDEAMAYYAAALRSAPHMTSTRQYLGEAFLQKGDRTAALGQLGEIERLCGTRSCEHYRLLAEAIARGA